MSHLLQRDLQLPEETDVIKIPALTSQNPLPDAAQNRNRRSLVVTTYLKWH
jgi:hypothetical protein